MTVLRPRCIFEGLCIAYFKIFPGAGFCFGGLCAAETAAAATAPTPAAGWACVSGEHCGAAAS
jgi:hypothetical protein